MLHNGPNNMTQSHLFFYLNEHCLHPAVHATDAKKTDYCLSFITGQAWASLWHANGCCYLWFPSNMGNAPSFRHISLFKYHSLARSLAWPESYPFKCGCCLSLERTFCFLMLLFTTFSHLYHRAALDCGEIVALTWRSSLRRFLGCYSINLLDPAIMRLNPLIFSSLGN